MEADVTTYRRKLVRQVLEACRVEVVRRLLAKDLPPTMKIQQLIVINDPEGTGWRSEWRQAEVSPLRFTEILIAIRDESRSHMLIGLADELRPLAEHLNASTDLGTRSANFWPTLRGVDAILARYLAPLAIHYLQQLRDVRRARPSYVDSLAADLDQLCDPSAVIHSSQLALAGVRVRRATTYRGITLRPLSPSERGAVLEGQQANWSDLADTGEFVLPRRFEIFVPAVLMETQATRSRKQPHDQSRLAHRVALALFLSDVDISSAGVLVTFDRPRWASIGFGMSHSPFPVSEKLMSEDRLLSPKEFRAIVDLAHQIPKFGTEDSGRDIALFRVLRGCGMHWQESGFLDFAIALEAALLGGVRTELAYRFSLYGALYLQDQRAPSDTFGKLNAIYDVRSRLVHGDRVKADKRAAAERDAADLAKAVTRKAVLEGWPDRRVLDGAALRAGSALLTGGDNGDNG